MILQNTNINIRIPKQLKDRFVEVTQQAGVSYSLVLRDMIRDYIAQKENKTSYHG